MSFISISTVAHFSMLNATIFGFSPDILEGLTRVAPMCPPERTHWHNLANMIEPSVCSDDAALCHITVNTYYYY